MKPKKRALTWSAASAVRLYLDELEEIEDILLKAADEVQVEHPDFDEIASSGELQAVEAPIRQLTLRAHKSYGPDHQSDVVRVLFAPDSVRVIAAEDTPELRGILDELKHVIWGAGWIISSGIPTLIAFVGMIAVAAAVSLGAAGEWALVVSVIVAAVIILNLLKRAYGRLFTTIVPEYRYQGPSFWKRNRDLLIVGIVTGTVGAVIGAGMGAMLTWWLTSGG